MAKKLFEVCKKIELRPYKHDLYIIVTNDIRASFYKRKRKIKATTEIDSNTHAFVWRADSYQDQYMFLPNTCGVGTIAHEAFHAAYHVLTESGVRLSRDSEEAWSYMIGEIAYQITVILDKYQKQKNKSKKALDKKVPVVVVL